MDRTRELSEKLIKSHSLSEDEYKTLIDGRCTSVVEILADAAVDARKKVYGTDIYIRGLVEISNYCRNDCYYCGIRRSNKNAERYRLTPEEIIECADAGYELGFRTIVMQGGEDAFFTDELLTDIISKIKKVHPDIAVTLSLGERGKDSFQRLFDARADRYLLRHETADAEHYGRLHPKELALEYRMQCLKELKDIGFQTGCGFMVGSPYQTSETLAKDLKFIEEFKPDMCGIGPFIPHHDTPFRHEAAGTLELTCFLLSVIRLIHPHILLPATTALGTIDPMGREKGMLSGANVVMPNLSPKIVRKKYELYDNKLCTGDETAEELKKLEERFERIGYKIAKVRGDVKEANNGKI